MDTGGGSDNDIENEEQNESIKKLITFFGHEMHHLLLVI